MKILLYIIGFAALVASPFILVYKLAQKKPKKLSALLFVAGCLIIIAGSFCGGKTVDSSNTQEDLQISSDGDEQPESTETEERTSNGIAEEDSSDAVASSATTSSTSSEKSAASTSAAKQAETEKTTSTQESPSVSDSETPYIEEETLSINLDDYWVMCDDLLYEYGKYMDGQNVITVITVDSISTSSLKANTGTNDSLFFDIVCDFGSKEAISKISEGDTVTVCGTLENQAGTGIWKTITINDCMILGGAEYESVLEEDRETQVAVGEAFKAHVEEQEALAVESEREAYMAQCSDVSYADVERNPDQYDGTYVKVSGTVKQVIEGWFNSVTLRLSENGNIWVITYTREDGESRILEGDSITAYGKCSGVSNVTTILGEQLTLPSMSMQYYN
jgi:uncharacterized membrane protein YcgQ (UPF0703/DUF1980 family)